MDSMNGVDVSWMIHGSPRESPDKSDQTARITQRRNTLPPAPQDEPRLTTVQSAPPAPTTPNRTGDALPPSTPPGSGLPSPKPVASSRPTLTRNGSAEKTTNGVGTPPQRRNSWFSNISSKFSSVGQSPPQANNTPPKQAELSVPRANPAKNAVLQHAAKYDGEGPYTPAPPKSSQAGLLQVLRRLSSSTSGTLSPNVKGNHGLVERKILNVDRHRERCLIAELNPSKLRRVSFCVDVEIAPMPKYDEHNSLAKNVCQKTLKRTFGEKGEGEALKSDRATCDEDKETNDASKSSTGEAQAARRPADAAETKAPAEPSSGKENGKEGSDTQAASGKRADPNRKKEKKKKSEEERKARKEKKRKFAEVNGMVPMEIYLDSDSSSEAAVGPTPDHSSALRTQSAPTTNPVRIYRRCCQLRETPILKKITEQLSNPENVNEAGVVEKLDLTGYWMQLPDLVTLGDYLAVVPINEVVLENCGLNDEGLRVVLAGLLAAKRPQRRARKPFPGGDADGYVVQGGVVERLVLRNNKIGPEGWKHLCQFVYLCRSLKYLDVSILPFPHSIHPPSASSASRPQPPVGGVGPMATASPPPSSPGSPIPSRTASPHPSRAPTQICQLFSKCIGTRLAGCKLELLNLAETLPDTTELGVLIDGIIKCGIKQLGLARNNIDDQGIAHVARYLASGKCEGLDLVGNDLRDGLGTLTESLPEDALLLALNLAECNLKPGSLCALLPKLAKLPEFRFIDLSHNQDLFGTSPSSISLLRRYLPKMAGMKRIHLKDVAMNSEQAIALAEILPEIKGLAHISLLENPEISKLADAKTEETQEEACALYASLLAATRVSHTIVAVDVDVPTEQSSEIVKALAKQLVAYCLRNMESLPLGGVGSNVHDPEYPDVLQHLVGHDVTGHDEQDDDYEAAPDDNYVIGGTGVVKALACCLKNRSDDSRRASGEFIRDTNGPSGAESSPVMSPSPSTLEPPRRKISGGKAKDMSKHLLNSARKIRHRLQPAMKAASMNAVQDAQAYHRLLFLDRTLDGIIKRFEDEFPDTREQASDVSPDRTAPPSMPLATSFGSEAEAAGALSEGEDEDSIRRPAISRSNSIVSMTSKGLTNEEGRVFRAAHKFRSGWITQQHYDLLLGAVEQIESNPGHVRFLHEMLEELGDEFLNRKAKEEGLVAVFRDSRDYITEKLRSQDPEQWERFVESQKMARANMEVSANGGGGNNGSGSSSSGSSTSGSDAGASGTDTAAIGGGGGGAGGSRGGRPQVSRPDDAAGGAGSSAVDDEVAVSD